MCGFRVARSKQSEHNIRRLGVVTNDCLHREHSRDLLVKVRSCAPVWWCSGVRSDLGIADFFSFLQLLSSCKSLISNKLISRILELAVDNPVVG